MAKATNEWGRFNPIAPDDFRNIIASSQGLPGSGKSHFWLTAPEPIAWFLFDPGGLKGLSSNPLFKDRDVRVRDYCGALNIGKLDKVERIKRSLEIFQEFQEDWDVAIRKARTLVVDKESLLWEMVRYAHDEVDSPTPKNFHELNLLYRGWVQDAEANQRNLGLLRDMHDTWGIIGVSKEGKKQQGFTGIYKPDGQKYVPGLVQINMQHGWDSEKRKFHTTIMDKCRLGNAERLMGKRVDNLDFPMLGVMLYPESDVEDWE